MIGESHCPPKVQGVIAEYEKGKIAERFRLLPDTPHLTLIRMAWSTASHARCAQSIEAWRYS